jgi:CheY-like chemotaxis protein
MLDVFGASFDTAENGIDAVAAAAARNYDAILMDVQMPALDGVNAIKRIRAADHPARSVPIIAMTAHAGDLEKDRCFAAGASDYLAKPLTPASLEKALSRALTKLAATG